MKKCIITNVHELTDGKTRSEIKCQVNAGSSLLAEVFKGKAKKYNRFQKLQTWYLCLTHSCKNCIRRHFSYPYTCNDGWPRGNPDWEDKGHCCINWTDDNNAPVD